MLMKCTYCNGNAPIVKRYRGHEYRLCSHCNKKFITHEEKDRIVIDEEFVPRRHFFDKKGE